MAQHATLVLGCPIPRVAGRQIDDAVALHAEQVVIERRRRNVPHRSSELGDRDRTSIVPQVAAGSSRFLQEILVDHVPLLPDRGLPKGQQQRCRHLVRKERRGACAGRARSVWCAAEGACYRTESSTCASTIFRKMATG